MPSDAKGKAHSVLRRRLPPTVHVWRIENAAGSGLPDVYAVGAGISFWVELKVGRIRPTAKVPREKLRPAQLATLARLTRAGVPCFVAIYCRGALAVYKFSVEFWSDLASPEGAFMLEAKLPGENGW